MTTHHCVSMPCPLCAPARKVEIRDGRRYVDGVDVGPAQPNTFGAHQNTKDGAARRARRRR